MAIVLAEEQRRECIVQGRVEAYSYHPDQPLDGASRPFHARGRTTDLEFVLKSSGFGVTEFEREVKAYLRMRDAGGCPGILSPVDIIEAGDDSYLILPFIHGQDFYDFFETYSTLKVEALAPILKSLCETLSFTHRLGIVHRDVKIENVRLGKSSATGKGVYLLDFNSSVCSDVFPIRNAMEGVAGTLEYLAPEVWLRDPYDQRVDLYALSVLVFNALTGDFPFQYPSDSTINSQWEIAEAHLHADIPSAVECNPLLPRGIDRFFEKGLAKDQEQRYRTAEELYQGFLQNGE